jgi:hypothetical protein
MTIRKTDKCKPFNAQNLDRLHNIIKRAINDSSISLPSSFVEIFSDRQSDYVEESALNPYIQNKAIIRLLQTELKGCYYHDPDPSSAQVACITARGGFGLSLLRRMVVERAQAMDSFELIGLKFLNGLTEAQAKIITPYPVGHPKWQASLRELISTSDEYSDHGIWMLVVRKVNAYKYLETMVSSYLESFSSLSQPIATSTSLSPSTSISSSVDFSPHLSADERLRLSIILSRNPEMCYATLNIFFRDSELGLVEPSNESYLSSFPSLAASLSTSPTSSKYEPMMELNLISRNMRLPPRGFVVSVLLRLSEMTDSPTSSSAKKSPTTTTKSYPLQQNIPNLVRLFGSLPDTLLVGMQSVTVSPSSGLVAKLLDSFVENRDADMQQYLSSLMTENAQSNFKAWCTDKTILAFAVWTTQPDKLVRKLYSSIKTTGGKKSGAGKDSALPFPGLMVPGGDLYVAPTVGISQRQIFALFKSGAPLDVRFTTGQLGTVSPELFFFFFFLSFDGNSD